MISWIVALKKFNKGKDCWCIPKKGSSGHQEVLRLMKNPSSPPDKTPFWSKLAAEPPKAKKKPPKAKKLSRKFTIADDDDDYNSVDAVAELAAIKQAGVLARALFPSRLRNPKQDTPKTIKTVKKVSPHKGGAILFGRAPKTPPGKLLSVRRRSGVQSR